MAEESRSGAFSEASGGGGRPQWSTPQVRPMLVKEGNKAPGMRAARDAARKAARKAASAPVQGPKKQWTTPGVAPATNLPDEKTQAAQRGQSRKQVFDASKNPWKLNAGQYSPKMIANAIINSGKKQMRKPRNAIGTTKRVVVEPYAKHDAATQGTFPDSYRDLVRHPDASRLLEDGITRRLGAGPHNIGTDGVPSHIAEAIHASVNETGQSLREKKNNDARSVEINVQKNPQQAAAHEFNANRDQIFHDTVNHVVDQVLTAKSWTNSAGQTVPNHLLLHGYGKEDQVSIGTQRESIASHVRSFLGGPDNKSLARSARRVHEIAEGEEISSLGKQFMDWHRSKAAEGMSAPSPEPQDLSRSGRVRTNPDDEPPVHARARQIARDLELSAQAASQDRERTGIANESGQAAAGRYLRDKFRPASRPNLSSTSLDDDLQGAASAARERTDKALEERRDEPEVPTQYGKGPDPVVPRNTAREPGRSTAIEAGDPDAAESLMSSLDNVGKRRPPAPEPTSTPTAGPSSVAESDAANQKPAAGGPPKRGSRGKRRGGRRR